MRSVFGRNATTLAVLAGASAAFLATTMIESADARTRHRRARVAAPAYAPPFASIVVDANSGKVLQSEHADALRHPASITKVMTLFMLFEQLEKRRMSLNTLIPVSAHAASMPPTKLGLRPGASITVENAIKAMVTKSANDMAAAVGEAIGGSEDNFARMMTRKARALGMSRTTFYNASGLPHPHQFTTARDLTILGRVMRERFPQYFHYFATPVFHYGSAAMRNHNRLLGRIEGVDGIKTGYTRASGFNLLTTARRGNRRIVAVVLGGSSAGRRDAIMANLVQNHIDRASGLRSAPMIAERNEPAAAPVAVAAVAPVPPAAPARVEAVRLAPPAAEPVRRAVVASHAQPLATGRPIALAAYARTEPVRPAVITGFARTGDLVPAAAIPNAPVVLDGSTRSRVVSASATATGGRLTTPSNLRWLTGPAPLERPAPRPEFTAAPTPPAAIPHVSRQTAAPREEKSVATRTAPRPRAAIADDTAPATTASIKAPSSRPAAAHHGVMIQIGATDNPQKARDLLARAKTSSPGPLAGAKPFTEPVSKGGSTLYRARFAGLDERSAEAACRAIKRTGLGCFTTRN